MRILFLISIASILFSFRAAKTEDAAELREKGIKALNESQTDPGKVVDAARFFVGAEALYAQKGDEEKAVEMASFLYWCKKKMTLEDVNKFNNGGEAKVAEKLNAVEQMAPKTDEAQKWFDRAEKFAQTNPSEHFLIAVRYFEVASRFKGTDVSLKAQDLSLNEQALANNQKRAPVDVAKAPESTVAPIPPADKLLASEKLVKDLLKAEYANVDPAGRLVLCDKLLLQVDDNKGDAAAEYVLLREARDAAVLGGDCARVSQIFARVKSAFKIDPALWNAELQRLAKNIRTAELATAMALLLSLVGDDALAAENYEQALRAYAQAEELRSLIKDAALKTRLKEGAARVQTFKRESAAADAALKTLATTPYDPAANLAAGRYLFLRGDWEKCFPLLAKSEDKRFGPLAKREISVPTLPEQQALLGDEWFNLAEKESSLLKPRMQERAAFWYGAAMQNLSGLAKLKVEGQLKKLAPPEPSAAPIASKSAPGLAHSGNLKSSITLDLGRGVTLDLVLIPAGTFQMGSPEGEEGRGSDEHLHAVTISNPFYMGKYPVTQEQYEAITGRNPTKTKALKNPVEIPAWKDAMEYCNLLSERFRTIIPAGTKVQLPTEAQWEYACRAGTTTRFYSGNQDKHMWEVGWADKNSAKAAHPVGEKPKNAFGLYDMHGNVWQFCLDVYTERYEALSSTDPYNAKGTSHVVRGGTYGFEPKDCRSAKRGFFPGTHSPHIGFRIVVAAALPIAP